MKFNLFLVLTLVTAILATGNANAFALASELDRLPVDTPYIKCETRNVRHRDQATVSVAVDPLKNELLFEMFTPHPVSARFTVNEAQVTRAGLFRRIRTISANGTILETFDHFGGTRRTLPNFWDKVEWQGSGVPNPGSSNPFYGTVKIAGPGGVGATFDLWCRRN